MFKPLWRRTVAMWEWFIINGVWVFIGSAFGVILLFFIRQRVLAAIEKAAKKQPRPGLEKSLRLTIWTIIGILLALIAISAAAVIISREGMAAMITPETLQTWLKEHGTSILFILFLGALLWLAFNKLIPPLVGRVVVRSKGESKEGMKKRRETLNAVFIGTGKIIVVVAVIFMILSELDISIGPVLAGFGIVGIAIGFGAQYLIRDLIAGVFILLENQYRVGDVAKVADIVAIVEQVNLRKTVLRDLDGVVHHVPNGEIKVASNYTRHFSRVNLDISVAYGTDLDHAISVINRVGQELAADENWTKMIIKAPQVLRVNKLGDSGIDIKILGDVKPMQQWALMGELRLRLKKAFDEEGIEIPWPHVKLYFGESPGGLPCKACSQVNPPGSKFCSNCGASLSSK